MNGKDLKHLRKTNKITQKELSLAIEIPIGTIARIESTGADIKKVAMLEAMELIDK